MNDELSSGMLRLPGKRPVPQDIWSLISLLEREIPFTFVRFSDGESEIIHGNKLEISPGLTTFQGRTFPSQFPEWDHKSFDPILHSRFRRQLIASALFKAPFFFKGVLASSNSRKSERFLMERWNRFELGTLTFTDLLINSNYQIFLNELLPRVENWKSQLAVVSNHRALVDFEGAIHVKVPDNFFSRYESTLDVALDSLSSLPAGTLVLSSASSLSNVLGFLMRKNRPDITFIDVGSAINHRLGFSDASRKYLALATRSGLLGRAATLLSPDYRMKW